MSGPFIYSPSGGYNPTPYTQTYYDPQTGTPYIPDASVFLPSPSGGSSNPNTPRYRVRFANLPPEDAPSAQANREPRPSFHTTEAAPRASPYANAFLIPPPIHYTHNRRKSSGDVPAPTPWTNGGMPLPPWISAQPQPTVGLPPAGYVSASSAALRLHPLLDAVALPADFHLDLSYMTFRPLLLGAGTQFSALPAHTLVEPATHPPITRMRIICESIPQWPIDLEYNTQYIPASPGATTAIVPISLGDVLAATYRGLQIPIKNSDFEVLSHDSERAVAKAYTRRCKRVAKENVQGQGEVSKGVKRVDYLLDASLFRGLVPVPGEAVPTFKLMRA